MFPAGHLPSTAWCSSTLCPVHQNWPPQNAFRKTLDSSRIIWRPKSFKIRMTLRRASSPLSSSSSSNWFWLPLSSPYNASHEPVTTRPMPRLSLHKPRRVRSTTTSIGNKFGYKKKPPLSPCGSVMNRVFFFSLFFSKCTFSFVSFRDSQKILFKFQNWNFTSCRSLIFLPAGNFFSPARISFKISSFFSPLYFSLSNFPRSQENLGGHRLSCVYKVHFPGLRRKFSSSNRSCFHDFAHCYCSVSKMDSNLFIPRIFDPIISRSNQNNFPFRFQNSSSGLFPLRNFYFGLCWQFLFYF